MLLLVTLQILRSLSHNKDGCHSCEPVGSPPHDLGLRLLYTVDGHVLQKLSEQQFQQYGR